MPDLEKYIEQHLSESLYRWVSVGSIIGAVLFPLFSIPELFRPKGEIRSFILDRLIVVTVLLTVFFLNKIKKNRTYQSVLVTIAVIGSSVINELMTLSYLGHQSPFYVGMLIIAVVAIGLPPLSIPVAVLNAALIFFIYLIPILLFDRITHLANFLTANFYLLSAIATALTWRMISNKLILSELRLQYELTIERNKLAQLVHERTQDLRTTDQWYRSIFENSNDSIIIMNTEGEIINCNDKTCAMSGLKKDQLIGTNISKLVTDKNNFDIKELMQQVMLGKTITTEVDYRNESGNQVVLESSLKLIPIGESQYVLMVSRDISETKIIRERLFEAQKIEAISTLAGGIAHDFRNMITAILGYIDLIKIEQNISEKLIARTNVIRNAAANAGKMVSQLLSFARKNKYEMSSYNLNDIVMDTVKLMEMTVPDRIRIETVLYPRELIIKANVASIENVLVNLISNAKDAISNKGSIIVSTNKVMVGTDIVDFKFEKIPNGEYAVITVKDTGSGIKKELIPRIFEPFYTTKERGKGTGLGLALVYGVVTEHSGYIVVNSDIGVGTKFEVYIPIHANADRHQTEEKKSQIIRTIQEASILIVDDDQAVLTILRDALDARGYNVIAYEHPHAAIEAFKQKAERIKLVITDISMPQMDGYELIKHIRAISPDVKIVAMSAREHQKSDTNISAWIAKPFEIDHFDAIIRYLIES